jgi:hypothetical protein
MKKSLAFILCLTSCSHQRQSFSPNMNAMPQVPAPASVGPLSLRWHPSQQNLQDVANARTLTEKHFSIAHAFTQKQRHFLTWLTGSIHRKPRSHALRSNERMSISSALRAFHHTQFGRLEMRSLMQPGSCTYASVAPEN